MSKIIHHDEILKLDDICPVTGAMTLPWSIAEVGLKHVHFREISPQVARRRDP